MKIFTLSCCLDVQPHENSTTSAEPGTGTTARKLVQGTNGGLFSVFFIGSGFKYSMLWGGGWLVIDAIYVYKIICFLLESYSTFSKYENGFLLFS